jgi:AcrR family transcriptional regulator
VPFLTEGRRQPVQERSRARVERILAAALELLESHGSDAVTTRAVAEHAKVPVATLYQFFPNREVLLEDLLLTYLQRRDSEAADALAKVKATTLAEAVAGFFAFHQQQYRANPELVVLYYTARGAGRIPDLRAHRAWIAELIRASLIERGFLLPDTPELVVLVAIEMADRLVELAYRADPAGDPEILREGQLAVTRYLQAYAPDEPIRRASQRRQTPNGQATDSDADRQRAMS